MWTLGRAIAGIALLLFLGWGALTREKDPVDRCIAEGIFYPDQAKLAFEMDGSLLRITYSLDPWALTKNTAISVAHRQIANIVPCVLSASSDIDAVQFDVFATFRNIKGQESYERAIFAKISRATASEIVWKNIRSKDIPKLVDVYREHPGAASQPPAPSVKIDPTNEDDRRLHGAALLSWYKTECHRPISPEALSREIDFLVSYVGRDRVAETIREFYPVGYSSSFDFCIETGCQNR